MTPMALDSGAVEVGRRAPEFRLRDQHNVFIGLSDYRGKAVLLVFYPLAFTGVCSAEMELLQSEIDSFQNERVQVLAISVDSPYTLRVFADSQGLKFPMLSDFWPHGEVARAYGIFDDNAGVATRGTFLIDPQGIVRWKVVHEIGRARDQGEYHKALAAL